MRGHDSFTLDELAARAGTHVTRTRGGQVMISGACALYPGRVNAVAFAEAGVRPALLEQTAAAAVVTTPDQADVTDKPVVICERPRETFACMVSAFESALPAAGVADGAHVATGARVASDAAIRTGAVIEFGAVIGSASIVETNAVVGSDVVVGEGCHVGRGVVLESGVWLGAGVTIGAGAVLGARGFGLVEDGSGWNPIPQLGGVMIGDSVEIGANTTIDRGTLDDTRIQDHVCIDNQVHIGHNVDVGARTVIAGCTGIAGSVTIGDDCRLGGGVGISDHVTLGDGVWLTAGTLVPSDIPTAGVYSTGFKPMPVRAWWRCVAGLRRLDRLDRRVRHLEASQRTNRDIS